jgi:hypothetical protein
MNFISCLLSKLLSKNRTYLDCQYAVIVSKIKEDISQWSKYSKAKADKDRETFLQKKATEITE